MGHCPCPPLEAVEALIYLLLQKYVSCRKLNHQGHTRLPGQPASNGQHAGKNIRPLTLTQGKPEGPPQPRSSPEALSEAFAETGGAPGGPRIRPSRQQCGDRTDPGTPLLPASDHPPTSFPVTNFATLFSAPLRPPGPASTLSGARLPASPGSRPRAAEARPPPAASHAAGLPASRSTARPRLRPRGPASPASSLPSEWPRRSPTAPATPEDAGPEAVRQPPEPSGPGPGPAQTPRCRSFAPRPTAARAPPPDSARRRGLAPDSPRQAGATRRAGRGSLPEAHPQARLGAPAALEGPWARAGASAVGH
ncbi:basic proline-rich protein-like [Zalophus californianus]|uniref:Basic proline-rich protein-like n=1 Tax=Zalophus californianus TaxID=9704 RepID=A0A6P9FHG5_ZALCA|nr:basic proline-rich protein-like [Zalophus californianus]